MQLRKKLKFKPTYGRTLLEVLNEHVDSCPQTVACHQISYRKKDWTIQTLTFSQLRIKAIQYAEALKNRGLNPGDRVLVCVGEPNSFMVVFLGIMAAGCIPVPLPAPNQFGVTQTFIQRIRNVCLDCQPSLIICSSLSSWSSVVDKLKHSVPVMELSELEQHFVQTNLKRAFPTIDSKTIAFLQYTSGSTGNPKGIVITHENLAANIEAIVERLGIKPGDKIVSWLPLYHDMGLVGGLLTPLYGRMEAYLLTPLSFIMRPASWLRAISDFRVNYTIGPTYAYNVAANRIPDSEIQDLDLSNLTTALVGAEPIDRGTAEAFIRRFSAHGLRPSAFYPVYGMAEATLALAFPQMRETPHFDTVNRSLLSESGLALSVKPGTPEAISFVSVGTSLRGHDIFIQDPNTGKALPDRTVGQIVASGPSISPYYFADAKANADRRRMLRTGDLGYFADGKLYIADRLKDLIIVAGQNFMPSDIESTLLKNISSLRLGRIVAFSTKDDNRETESLLIAAEISPRFWRKQRKIRQEIIDTIFSNYRLTVADVLFYRPGVIPRTSSGKVQRRACRYLYLKGELPTLGERLVKVN